APAAARPAPQKPLSAHPDFIGGTLADLAQMDDKSRPIQSRLDGAIPLAEERIARKLVEKVPGLVPEQAAALARITREVIEEVAWEVVP
ncbi:MAG: hypothetical protein QME96_13525, partial [Myxococcota bacterium]|nr:hypothetical protein [Myxococcota bacterium]